MKRKAILVMMTILVSACGFSDAKNAAEDSSKGSEKMKITQYYNQESKISDIISDLDLGKVGRFLFPLDEGYWSGNTLDDLRLTWYNYIDPSESAEIVNTLKTHAHNGEKVFFDIYSEDEKKRDSSKRETGLFFFRGEKVQSSRFAARAADLPSLAQ